MKYNELIKDMDTAYNAAAAKDYEPLTDDEKKDMSDNEIEKWETKIKDSLLRRDSTLGNTSSALKSLMNTSFEINGKTYSLSSFGINTASYFSADTNEKGCLHIDGDASRATHQIVHLFITQDNAVENITVHRCFIFVV